MGYFCLKHGFLTAPPPAQMAPLQTLLNPTWEQGMLNYLT